MSPQDPETGDRHSSSGTAATDPGRRRWGGLSGKLLLLTVVFVMLSEVLIFVPSIANFRNTWLIDKLTISGVAASILVETDMVAPGVQAELLRTTGAVAIALDDGTRRRLIAMSGSPGTVARTVDMGSVLRGRLALVAVVAVRPGGAEPPPGGLADGRPRLGSCQEGTSGSPGSQAEGGQ